MRAFRWLIRWSRNGDDGEPLTNPLTGLPSYVAFVRWLDEHADARVALLVLDLDQMMAINDEFGAQVGDAILCEAAMRLRAEVEEHTLVAHLGMDHFAALTADPDRAEDVESQMRRAIRMITTPDGVPIEACVGRVVGPAGRGLLQEADGPLYKEKGAHADRRWSRASELSLEICDCPIRTRRIGGRVNRRGE